MPSTMLAIGTGKGLFLARSDDDRKSWDLSGPHFPMTGVYAVGIDTRRQPAAPARRGGELPFRADRGDQR